MKMITVRTKDRECWKFEVEDDEASDLLKTIMEDMVEWIELKEGSSVFVRASFVSSVTMEDSACPNESA